MEVHIGELIEARINEVGITKAEFGRRINTSRQNVNTILKKESLDTSLLKTISRVLSHDFFKYYTTGGLPVGNVGSGGDGAGKVSIMINLPAEATEKILSALFEGRVPDFLAVKQKS